MSGRAGPLTDLLAAWEAGRIAAENGRPFPRPNWCGGALLFFNRAEALAAWRGGVKFDTDPKELPDDARANIRVRCSGSVMMRIRDGREVRYALCASCAGLEMGNRKHLAEDAKKREEPARGRRRRGGFDV